MYKFEKDYKNISKLFDRQQERRCQLLENQREAREASQDQTRTLSPTEYTTHEDEDDIAQREVHNKIKVFNRIAAKNYSKYKLQFSEWMMEKPEDLGDWYLVPCPKGQRCLIIAEGGRTVVLNKNGKVMFVYFSTLPGGNKENYRNMTIIDGLYDPSNACFYALDLLAYRNQTFIDCSCDFRFFWLKAKLEEDAVGVKSKFNTKVIKSLPYASFMEPVQIDGLLGRHPAFENDTAKLDGLLFYHKESHYVYGETPLVLWLFPFMVEEVLGIRSVHPKYMVQKPKDYQDCKTYIEDFNVKLRQKNERKTMYHGQSEKMDAVETEENPYEEMDEIEFEQIESTDELEPFVMVDREMCLLETE